MNILKQRDDMRARLGRAFGEELNIALCPACGSDDVEEFPISWRETFRDCRRCRTEWKEGEYVGLPTLARHILRVCTRCNGIGRVTVRIPKVDEAEAARIERQFESRPSLARSFIYDEESALCPTCEGARLVLNYSRW